MNIKQWRESTNRTFQSIADEFGYKSPSTVMHWEKRGVNKISIINKLKKLSKNKIKDFGACL